MRAKRPKPKPTKQLEDLLKAYALQRLESQPSGTPKPKKGKPQKGRGRTG